MGILFKAPHPLFGRANKPLGMAYQQCSPYYWWWEFLRRNQQYIACCRAGGVGPLADLYADFGDVTTESFKQWWTQRGLNLFAEKPKPVKLAELNDASQWDANWTKDSVMVVAVPLDISKRALQGFFADLLKKRHKGQRGRKALSDKDSSSARYPLHRNVSIHTLRIQLTVYDAVMAKKRGEDKRTLAQIGIDLKLVKSAMPELKDTKLDAEDKRAVMAATVSRYFKDAERIVANTINGQFPKSR
jgi:hypothetical protein